MITIRHERLSDIDAREALLDDAFGETRTRKSSQRLREDRLPAEGLSFIAADGSQVIGTARLWNVVCGNVREGLDRESFGQSVLLLGPVAVAEDCRSRGLGNALVCRAIQTARKLGYAAIVLVGDPAYYNRFGFSGDKTGALWMPGPFERHRLLGRELKVGSLDGARGMIAATGRIAPQLDLAAQAAMVRPAATKSRPRTPHAA